ncbi:MAG: DNA topoisomerase IB [Actinomycetota bacterium]
MTSAAEAVAPPAPPEESAREAGLRYTTDDAPGITRKRSGKGFAYVDPDGRRVRDPETLASIRALAIPPAWTDVWICPNPRGHLQATGRDARGRKQYRYHPKWREVRDANKYDRLVAFGKSLPAIRRRVERDLANPGLPRERVLAAIIRLLESTLIRVGNEEYARENNSYGLTTLLDRHAQVDGADIEFRFRGKGGRQHRVSVRDRRLAKIVKDSQDLPGQQLFQYVDDEGQVQDIGSADVNDYLREISGQEFTAKDFRTWAGTLAAALALQELEEFDSEAQAKRNIVRGIERVAERLGNTPAVCRKCYVHPAILEAYTDGSMIEALRQRAASESKRSRGLQPEEAAILALLQRRLAAEARRRNRAA